MTDTPHRATPQPGQLPSSRRALLAGAGITCAAVLTGCTTYDANHGGFTGPAPTPASTAASASGAVASAPASTAASASGAAASDSASTAASAAGAPVAGALASTAQVPEGGGKIIDGKNIVITQPQAGAFKAFTAVCTHQGCIVSTVSGGTIDCPCHGSKFSIKDGSVVNGPATAPLAAVAIKVQGTSIVQA
jgi:Rieske Fe-S protein